MRPHLYAAERIRTSTGVATHKALKKWFEGVSVMYDSLRSPEVL
jgi:hypothetical protein